MATKDTGRKGEMLALAYLRRRGYTIVTTNWRCQHGEIDIIARDDKTLVFVEVRCRHADSAEAAFESVNYRKQGKMHELAYAYLATHQLENALWRIDVVAIALPRAGQPIIEQVENALDW